MIAVIVKKEHSIVAAFPDYDYLTSNLIWVRRLRNVKLSDTIKLEKMRSRPFCAKSKNEKSKNTPSGHNRNTQ